ncbi:MAG: type II toxin-antitoxin system RelE/ParE family toxin [Magnetococcales bacterium]|nr:type II toxin-antitoxin system RelE/ParE family toxin [Magnetococcales bacterium]
MEWEIAYHTEAVQQAIKGWPTGLRAVYTRITDRMKAEGPNLGMPFTRSMGDGLFEVRVKGTEGTGRAFFCLIVGRKVLVLHAFVKKTDKTPLRELAVARSRLKEVRRANT